MKRVLITGANSYIGTHVEHLLISENENGLEYLVDTLDMEKEWQEKDFSIYDAVLHVAGIAHRKETKANKHLYYEVNERLAILVAEKAKRSGVAQFIILSSMSVYGVEIGYITKDTKPVPKTHYGISKYNADNRILKMEDGDFKVSVLRPPMVYGKDCKGNYQLLRKMALCTPFFPTYKNERSMIYIDNLAVFIKGIIDSGTCGIFFPQDKEYVNTSQMVCQIIKCHNKKCMFTKVFNPIIKLGKRMNIRIINKVFGDLTYEKCDVVDGANYLEAIVSIEEQ